MKPYIFIHVPKTGGTSINEVINIIPTHHPAYHFIKDKYKWNNSFKFAFVRNPWDRLVSSYRFARMYDSAYHSADPKKIASGWSKHFDYDIMIMKTFEEFVMDLTGKDKNLYGHQSLWPQNMYLKTNGKIELDFLGRFETLRKDFRKIAKEIELDLKGVRLPNMNKSGKKCNYKDFYITQEMIDRVAFFYSEDIELFNYDY